MESKLEKHVTENHNLLPELSKKLSELELCSKDATLEETDANSLNLRFKINIFASGKEHLLNLVIGQKTLSSFSRQHFSFFLPLPLP